ncbi:MAG: hypothetical protein ACRENE_11125 [Polyangiaceae bacterium]
MSSNNGSKVTKTSLQKRIGDLVAGTQKHASSTTSVTLGGKAYAAPALVQLLQSLVDALNATAAARAGWQDALAKEHVLHASVLPVVEGYREWVAVTYAGSPALLADYGVSPPRARTPLTAEQKAAASVKRAATRKARGTLGSVQKKAVKGDVAGITVTPVTSTASKPSEAAPAAPTAPATSGVGTSAPATQAPGK